MKRFWLLAMLALAVAATAQAQVTYTTTSQGLLAENWGTIDTSQPSPQVNAQAFANYGSFSVESSVFGLANFPYTFAPWDFPQTPIPYDFANVLNYTNIGTMSGFTGFRFDTVTDAGQRLPANSIVNANGATITAQTYLLMSATNIANQGLLSATADALIQLHATNAGGTGLLDLSRGGVEIQPFNLNPGPGFCAPGGGGFDTSSNFFPEVGMSDAFWALGTNNFFGVTRVFQTNSDGTVNISSPLISLPSAHPFIFTNQVSSSNFIVEAVFVQDNDTNITSRVRFAPSTEGGNPAYTATVAMTTTATNVVTGQTINYAAYVLDSILSSTNFVLLTNLAFAPGTDFRPSPLKVTRITPCEFMNGRNSNAVIRPDLFYAPPINISVTNLIDTNPPPNFNITNILSILQTNIAYATNSVTNYNASYVAQLSETANTVSGVAPTNQPGRVEIEADNLNLTRARIRGENEVSIHTRNLAENSGSVIAVQNLNYDLGAANGKLVIRDLAPSTVRTFDGFVEAWTAKWTNLINITNNVITPDTNVPPNLTTNTTSSTIEVDYMILLVADLLSTVTPVSVNDFAMRSSNVVFYDKMTVNGTLNVDSTTFTMTNGSSLTIAGGSQNWDASDFPNLQYLTNQGSITVPNVTRLGSPLAPYRVVDNQGNFSTFGLQIWANQLNDSGVFSVRGTLKATANSAKLEGGRLSAAKDITLNAGYVKMRNFNLSASSLNLSVTNSLADNGSGASNLVQCPQGFSLVTKPAQGDLFGTTFSTPVSAGGLAQFVWAANDLGANAAGFSNNVVIGKLILNADANSLLSFTGVGASNAVYVDFLELDGAMTNNLDAALSIDNNMVIYFADSNLGGDYFLNHTNVAGGRLRWVSTFAGPNSSIPILLHDTGQTVLMNRSVRYSKLLDSDGDGIPNFYDATPLDFNDALVASPIALSVTLLAQPSPMVSLVWSGSTGTVFQVEYATNLAPATWQALASYTNAAPGGSGSFQDALPAGSSPRYYRVKLVR